MTVRTVSVDTEAQPSAQQQGKKRRRLKRDLVGWAFASPWVLGFVCFGLFPFIASIVYSFSAYSGLGPSRWVGLQNYQQLLQDATFGRAMANSMYYAIAVVLLDSLVAFLLALLLNKEFKFRGVFRTIFFLPSVTPLVATAVIWLWMFNPNSGVVNQILGIIGIDGPGWFADPHWSKPALIIMSLWHVGVSMLIYLAGLQDVPRELTEAAMVDGAGKLRRIWHVTLPMMSPVILFVMVTSLIGAVQLFTEVQVMTGGAGGPAQSTLTIALYLWQTAFQNFNIGYASAQAWILLLLIALLTAVSMRVSRSRIYYS